MRINGYITFSCSKCPVEIHQNTFGRTLRQVENMLKSIGWKFGKDTICPKCNPKKAVAYA